MNKYIKHLAVAAIVMSGLGFAQAEAASVAINVGVGGVSIAVSDKGKACCGNRAHKVVHDLRDRRHVDHCRMCQDAVRREESRRREEARRRAMHRIDHRRDFRQAKRR